MWPGMRGFRRGGISATRRPSSRAVFTAFRRQLPFFKRELCTLTRQSWCTWLFCCSFPLLSTTSSPGWVMFRISNLDPGFPVWLGHDRRVPRRNVHEEVTPFRVSFSFVQTIDVRAEPPNAKRYSVFTRLVVVRTAARAHTGGIVGDRRSRDEGCMVSVRQD